MREDRIRWNRKYAEREWPAEPSAIVSRFFYLARPGLALDIAAGTGRNALFLAGRGFEVVAADIAEEGLRRLAGVHDKVHPLCVDLDAYDIPEGRFHLIINIMFLSRRLFPHIIHGLARGGLMIFETFIDFPAGGSRRHSRDYRLDENELLRAFLPLHVLYYEETEKSTDEGQARIASLVAEKR
jgi:SAM-dependent methyltransferase